ncbi:amidophosphoribosyltransferase [Chlamydiota bacterium]
MMKNCSNKKEFCGIVGISNHPEAAQLTYLGLFALQHRGEESAGIISLHKKKINQCLDMGLVGDIFTEQKIKALKGSIAIGHVRYSTTGSSSFGNIQPFLVNHKNSHFAVAHNGNIVNAFSLRNHLEENGALFQTSMDSEIILHLLAHSKARSLEENITHALSQLKGSFSLVMLANDVLIGARDPNGFKPLCLGKLDKSYVLASETCALDLLRASYVREVEPGEIIIIRNNEITSIKPFPETQPSYCVFEYIYFARPDSNIFGKNVYIARKQLGKNLAREHPQNNVDFIMPIPDSGNYAALGYAEEANIPFETGMIRNHYIGRTFIQPSQNVRDFRVRVKLNPIKEVLKNKRIVVVEDSIVRGTTSKSRVKALREAGVKEIHMRISSPPLRFPCFYGIDFPTKKELIANKRTVSEITEYLGLNSLGYLSIDGMLDAMPFDKCHFCTACFSGKYPIKPRKKLSKKILE